MLTKKLIDGLYVEAMLLADEVRAYFDDSGRDARDSLDPMDRVLFSCESLKVTTRLMHVIAWLLTQRAIDAGEVSVEAMHEPARRLGKAIDSEDAVLFRMPPEASHFVEASIELYARIERIDSNLLSDLVPHPSPARQLLGRLQQAF